MNTFKQSAAQGDLLITKIDEIPEGLSKQDDIDGNHVLAHSETGHNHVVDAQYVDLYQPANDDFIGYVDVKGECQIIHLRSWDTHAPINLDKGKYKITRQREYTPEGYRRAAD